MDLPLVELNRVLVAGRFAPLHPERSFDDVNLGPVRDTLRFLLARHEPNSAVVIDDLWNVLLFNEAHRRIMALFAPESATATGRPINLMREVFDPRCLRPSVANFAVLGPLLRQRVAAVADAMPGDRRPGDLLAELDQFNTSVPEASAPESGPPSIVLPVVLEKGAHRLSLITTVTRFAAPLDATVQSLQLQTFFPLDEPSRVLLERRASESVRETAGTNG
jgi:hypothetical protein